MAARTIDGPDKDWLTSAEVRVLFGISKGTLQKLIRSGEFPTSLEIVPGGMRGWSWEDIVYWRLRVARQERLKKSEGQTGPISGQPGPKRARKPEDD